MSSNTFEDFHGKAAFITGGASGIGRAIAEALAQQGCRVVLADIEAPKAEAAAAAIEQATGVAAIGVGCDVTSIPSLEAAADQAWKQFGQIDLLFNNAGVGGSVIPAIDTPATQAAWVMAVNFTGVANGCAIFGPRFRDAGTPAWIVNTGSEHSLGFVHTGMAFYTASKHAVLGLSDVMRNELPENIGISVLCPGLVDTQLWNAGRNRPEEFGGPEEAMDVSRMVMEQGIGAAEIGERVLAGIAAGKFLIVTHSHSRAFSERRGSEVEAAFRTQAPPKDGDERYNIQGLLDRLFDGAPPDSE